jgi:penicillin-binding protein 1B
MARKASRRKRKTRSAKPRLRISRSLVLKLGLVLTLLVGLYVVYLDMRIQHSFEGQRWALPARVFARPLELYAGLPLSRAELLQELKLLRYRRDNHPEARGTYTAVQNGVVLVTRGFRFPDGEEKGQRLRVVFSGNKVSELRNAQGQSLHALVRIEPLLIANIYPTHQEDRDLVQLDEVPPLLTRTLMVVEDKDFYEHHGIKLTSIARAMLANLRAGRAVQGGSTLTQQLVKNYFLSSNRTLWRKLNEAIMAVLLELHNDKDEILQAYLNEVYLGQSGAHGIHGFGLASQFYFQRHLKELKPEQFALLVALVKGPSYYNPRRHPERARQRRDLVLDLMAENGLITQAQATRYKSRPLGVSDKAPPTRTPFPAFVELVREQLKRDYNEEDLRSEGLLIFTTLNPLIQLRAEQGIQKELARIERSRGKKSSELESAAVVVHVGNGEIQALVGGRDPRFVGFNRALNARRPVGSLIKPLVFLDALKQDERYTLASLLDDAPLKLTQEDGTEWSPDNYDHESHGQVVLEEALIHSYNQATARLGMEIGVPRVTRTLAELGGRSDVRPYPSVLLGAVDMTPLEVARVYQSLATEGYRMPLRAIRAVMDKQGNSLKQYDLDVRQVEDPRYVFLVTAAMHEVTRSGTARSLQKLLPRGLEVAGKTGTTNDLRDSWFAGFSADYLSVVWVGRDDNGSSGLSGATGALPVWAYIMRGLHQESISMNPPHGVEWSWIDTRNGLRGDEGCEDALRMPFIAGTVPQGTSACASGSLEGTVKRSLNWLKKLFESE